MAVGLNKADRLARLHEEAVRARGLDEFRCQNPKCGAMFGKYEPPVRMYVQVKCYRCNLYSELVPT